MERRPREPALHSGLDSTNTTRQLFKFLAGESAHRLGAHTAGRNGTQNQAGCGLVVRSIGNYNVIVLSHHKIKANQLCSHFTRRDIKSAQALGGVFDLLETLFSESDQANVGWHKSSSRSSDPSELPETTVE